MKLIMNILHISSAQFQFNFNTLTWKVHERGGQNKLEDNCQEGNSQDQDDDDD